MPRYLITVPHEDEHVACVRALDAISSYGSHYITNASWGCTVGEHAGYLLADLSSREEALQMVPPQFRRDARIVEVEHMTRQKVEDLLAEMEQ